MSPWVDVPTKQIEYKSDAVGETVDTSSSGSIKFTAKIDEKGRISIPADIRKSLGLSVGSCLELDVSLFLNLLKPCALAHGYR